MRRYLLNRVFVLTVALWAAALSLPPAGVFAYPSESLPLVQSQFTREAQIRQIMAVLSRPEAQIHLRLTGISDSEANAALQRLDDAQLAQLATKAEAVKAGGGAAGVVIVILVVVLLIILIVKLMDKRIEIKDEKK